MTKLSALGMAVLATAGVASASTFSIGSFGTGNGSNPGFSNTATVYNPTSSTSKSSYDLDPGTTWHAPLSAGGTQSYWVGQNPNDGPGSSTPHHEPNGTYTYHSYFTTTGSMGEAFGTLSVLADDTMTVKLNGITIFSASDPAFNHTCNDFTPNCLDVATANLIASDFVSGQNVLEFDLKQTNDYSNGLDFAGTINTTPEPSSLLLLGTGLVGSAGALLRRMRA